MQLSYLAITEWMRKKRLKTREVFCLLNVEDGTELEYESFHASLSTSEFDGFTSALSEAELNSFPIPRKSFSWFLNFLEGQFGIPSSVHEKLFLGFIISWEGTFWAVCPRR